MDNGLYRVAFKTQKGSGAGIAILNDGTIRGGDSMMFYVGNYEVQGGLFNAKLTTGAHTKVPGMGSVFGRDIVHIHLSGQSMGSIAQLSGTAIETPGVLLSATLTRLA